MRSINVLLTYFLLVRCLKVMLLVIREHQPLKVVITTELDVMTELYLMKRLIDIFSPKEQRYSELRTSSEPTFSRIFCNTSARKPVCNFL